jgi:hypothetical protein
MIEIVVVFLLLPRKMTTLVLNGQDYLVEDRYSQGALAGLIDLGWGGITLDPIYEKTSILSDNPGKSVIKLNNGIYRFPKNDELAENFLTGARGVYQILKKEFTGYVYKPPVVKPKKSSGTFDKMLRPKGMDIIQLFMNSKETNDSLIDVSRRFERIISSVKDDYIFQMVKSPLYLYQYVNDIPEEYSLLGGRAFLVNNRFVWKHDEQKNANSLSFITNLFATVCKINCPDMIITDKKYNLGDASPYDHEKNLVQIIQFVPGWKDYTPSHSRSDKFIKQLAAILAFDLTIANTDRFLFITRHIENIIFSSDPQFEPVDVWVNPPINEGNFGFVGTDLWTLDHRAIGDKNYIVRLHEILNDDFLSECTNLMANFFGIDDAKKYFFVKLKKYLNHNLSMFSYFKSLYSWILNQ